MASLAPHAPYQAPEEDVDAYKDLPGDIHRHIYAAMITDLDTQVGRIVDEEARKSPNAKTPARIPPFQESDEK